MTLYGLDSNSRVADPDDPRKVFSWLIHRTLDDKGNVAVYDYVAEDGAGVERQAHEANRTDALRGTQRYLKTIRYGNIEPYFADWSSDGPEAPLPAGWHFQVVMDYGDHASDAPAVASDQAWSTRPDPFSLYRSGFEVRTYRRCHRILMFHHFADDPDIGVDCLVRSTDLRYKDEDVPADPRNPIYTLLSSVTQTGYRRVGNGYQRRSVPPSAFAP